MTLTFLPGDGQTRSRLALFADTPFGTYIVEGWHWWGLGAEGVETSEAEAIKAAKADYKSRCRRM